jgi:hypothetical protein
MNLSEGDELIAIARNAETEDEDAAGGAAAGSVVADSAGDSGGEGA